MLAGGEAAPILRVRGEEPREAELEAQVGAVLGRVREAASADPDMLRVSGYSSMAELSTDIDYLLASASREELLVRLAAALDPRAIDASAIAWPGPWRPGPEGDMLPSFCCIIGCEPCLPPDSGDVP